MKTTNFLASGVVGGIVNFLLGWIFYGMLFPDLYPTEGEDNMLFIALGCLSYAFFMAYIFTGVANIVSAKQGFKVGAIFGFFYGLTMNLFMYSSMEPNYQNITIDVVISLVIGAITGIVIALVNGKMK